MNKAARRILIGSGALVFAGLVGKILEPEILRLKSLAFINETAAARAKNPDDGYIFQRRAGYYKRLTNIAELAQFLNPSYYIDHLRNFYDRNLSRKGYEAGKS